MSNLIPSLETFAKAGRHSTSLRSHTSSDTALCSAAWGFFFHFFSSRILHGMSAYGRFLCCISQGTAATAAGLGTLGNYLSVF